MKKIYISILMALLVQVSALAQGWPANYGGVMLQGFFWDSYRTNWDGYQTLAVDGKSNYTWATMYGAGWTKDGNNVTDRWALPNTTWQSLIDHKDEIAPFIDLLWLPQSGSTVCPEFVTYNGSNKTRPYREQDGYQPFGINNGDQIVNADNMGFVPVFYFNHGRPLTGDTVVTDCFGNVLTPKSYFGTEAQLKQLISEYKAQGCFAIEDVVANHRGGLSTWTQNKTTSIDFPNEVWTSPDGVRHVINWTSADVCSDDESGEGTGGPDSGGQGQWAADIAHNNASTREKVELYLRYLTEELGYSGYRLDYAQGMSGKNMADYMYDMRPTFAVGENWNMDRGSLESWINSTFRNDHFQCAAFDFPLKRAINVAFEREEYWRLDGYTNDPGIRGSSEFVGMTIKPLINDAKYRRYAVTFVENHDTFKDLPTDDTGYKDRLQKHVLEANAFILTMPGTPCLFYAHFMHPDWHDTLVKLIKARRTAGITNESAAVKGMEPITGTQGAKWVVSGSKGEMCIILCDNAHLPALPTGFSEVWSSDICRVGITSSLASQVNDNEREQQVNGFPVIDLGSGVYDNPQVTIKPSNDDCVLVYTTNGHNPQPGDPTISAATATKARGISPRSADNAISVSKTLTFDKTTTLKVGVLVNGTVPTSTIVTREFIVPGENSSSTDYINIYVKANDAPNLYLWYYDNDGNKVEPNGSWAGSKATDKLTVGGLEWHHLQVANPNREMSMIINWDGKNQTADIDGITSDVFYILYDGVPTNVTETYLPAITNPMVSIDKGTGTYKGGLTATVTATYSGATIVYTTDGNEPTASSATLTSGATLSFNTTGNHILRAGILKDGEVINQVARSYNVVNGTGSGINIFVKNMTTGDVPHIYAWDSNQQPLTASWNNAGDVLTETETDCGQTWYKKHFDQVPEGLLFMLTGDKDKTADITGLSGGNYYFYYYPGAHFGDAAYQDGYINVTADSKHTTTRHAINVFMYDNNNEWSSFLKLYPYANSQDIFWNWKGSWAEEGFPTTTINGQSWFYCTFMDKESIDVILFNNKNDSERFTGTGVKDNIFIKFPRTGSDWSGGNDMTSSYAGYLPQVETPVADDMNSQLPSCATPMNDCLYFYFENDGYDDPYTWVYNNTTIFSGSGWPGEALVEVVGSSPSGNLIYRWTYYGDTAVDPANVIFSNNGDNTTQSEAMEFVNGGYYTSHGLQGTITGNLMTLAEIVKSGKTGSSYTISNDLSSIFIDKNGTSIFAKDGDGDALNISRNSDGKKVHEAMTDWTYNQSNWIEIKLPQALTSSQMEKMNHKTLLGQTIVGTLTGEVNPTIEVQAMPIPTTTEVNYEPNNFTVANFMESNVNGDYFLVTPQPQEYATIEWAVYHDGMFYMPLYGTAHQQEVDYKNPLSGALSVGDDTYRDDSDPTFVDGTEYELKVIVKRKGAQAVPALRAIDVKPSSESALWNIAVVSAKALGDDFTTAVTKVGDDSNRVVVRTRYYNMMGSESDRPFRGINVIVREYNDGTRTATKSLVR